MRKILLLVCVWGVMGAGCNYTSKDWVYLANLKLNKQDYLGAFKEFDKALQIDNLNPNAYYGRGIARSHLNDYTGAISDYTRAICIRHNFIVALNKRASLKLELNDTSGCIDDYDKIVAIDTNYGTAYCSRGKVKLMMGNYNGAIQDVTKGVEVEPNDTAKHTYIKICYLLRSIAENGINNINSAMTDADSALILDPKNVFANINKGILEYEVHDFDKATEYLNLSIKLNNKLPDPYYYLAMIDIKNGYKDISCSELRKAANLGLNHGEDTIRKYCK